MMKYELYDKNDNVVATVKGSGLQSGVLKVENVKPWWPIGMSDAPGYLYTLKVRMPVSCFVCLVEHWTWLFLPKEHAKTGLRLTPDRSTVF